MYPLINFWEENEREREEQKKLILSHIFVVLVCVYRHTLKYPTFLCQLCAVNSTTGD